MATESHEAMLAGRYRKLETIGTGGMAQVVLAEDERLGRRVAVKRLHADSPGDTARRFEREARLGASLNHPNLVSVYDVATEGESVLIVMEYVRGETLREAIATGKLEPRRAVSILRDVAAGLDHAHSHGIVHRDVKPANILLRDDGVAKLADLGIATAAHSTKITRSGVVLGTAAYMAPEQLEGREASAASDVYSLAAVAFEAVSGEKPREGATPMEIAHRAVNEPPPELRAVWPEAPEGASRALARGMSSDPGARQSSAGELVSELEQAFSSPSRPAVAPDPTVAMAPTAPKRIRATPASAPPPRSSRGPSRIPALAALLLLLLAGGGIAVAALGGGGGGDDEPRSTADRSKQKAAKKKARRDTKATPAPAAPAGEAGGTEAAPADDQPVDEAPATGGGDPAALNSQGYSLMQQGRYDEAIPLLEQAVAAYPSGSTDLTYAYALFNLGSALRQAGRPDEAIPILERRLQIPNQQDTVREELEAARRAAG